MNSITDLLTIDDSASNELYEWYYCDRLTPTDKRENEKIWSY
jgi:hypothetical protein